LIIHGLID